MPMTECFPWAGVCADVLEPAGDDPRQHSWCASPLESGLGRSRPAASVRRVTAIRVATPAPAWEHEDVQADSHDPHAPRGPAISADPTPILGEVVDQHVVSRVLLKRFTVPFPKTSGWRLTKFNLDRPDGKHPPKPPRACAFDPYFVPVDTVAIEALWKQTEDAARPVFAAIDRGEPFADAKNAQILRDLIALHLVRSYRYRKVYNDSFHRAYADLRANMLGPRREIVRAEALRVTGLYLPNGPALAAFLDPILEGSLPAKGFSSGQLFRESIEETFGKIRSLISSWEPELLTAKGGQFIIGDSPSITIRWPSGRPDLTKSVDIKTAVGDAHTVVLPLGPKHLVALGPGQVASEVGKPIIEWLNALQVVAAYRHVFFKPNDETQAFVRAVCHARSK